MGLGGVVPVDDHWTIAISSPIPPFYAIWLQKYYNYRNLKQAAEHQHGIGQADRVIFGTDQAENGETDDDDGEE